MLTHVGFDSVDVLEEAYVTQLIELVMTDGLDGHLLLDIFDIVLGCGNAGDTRARKADLGCGAEFKYHIRVACLGALA